MYIFPHFYNNFGVNYAISPLIYAHVNKNNVKFVSF